MTELVWLSGFNKGERHNLSGSPAPAIMAGGLGGSGHGQYEIVSDGKEDDMDNTGKPPYRVALMSEIAGSKTHGLKVASTFSGGGGSCTGYKMAGFLVVWANEFVPSAQETYRANHPETHLDCRSIVDVKPEEILAATGLKKGELDVFDGSPPCQAFSTAGKREKGWKAEGGSGKKYEGGAVQHNEMLFFEYIRLLRGLMPKVFVAENVKGLTIGAAKERMMGDEQRTMFGGHKFKDKSGVEQELTKDEDTILHQLMDSGYRVEWRVLDAKNHGVPQTRNRVIFVGVRSDLVERFKVGPVFPKPLPYVYTVRDACPWIGALKYERGEKKDGVKRESYNKDSDVDKEPVNTIPASCDSNFKVIVEHRCGLTEVREEIIVANEKFNPVFGAPDVPSPTIMAGGPCGSSGQVRAVVIVQQQGGGFSEKREFGVDNTCPAVCSSQPNQFLVYEGGKPVGAGTGQSLELDKSREKVCDGTQAFGSAGDCAVAGEPSPTVLTPSNSVVLKEERRKFTIAEVKRICAFPDDYVLTGSYAKQWERLGNSVPPVMMAHVAAALRDGVFAKIGRLEWFDRPKFEPPQPAEFELGGLKPAAEAKPKKAASKKTGKLIEAKPAEVKLVEAPKAEAQKAEAQKVDAPEVAPAKKLKSAGLGSIPDKWANWRPS